MKLKKFFVAIDGDSVGREIEKLIISEDLEQLISYSHSITRDLNNFRLIVESLQGKIYLCGGDNILAEVSSYKTFLEKFYIVKSSFSASFSVGIGENTVQAYLALKFAKSAGRGLVILSEFSHGEFCFKQIT